MSQAVAIEPLVRQAQQRDADAFGRLIGLFERTVLAIAYGVLKDASLAGDVAQDTFLRAWERLGELKEPATFPSWIARMARNQAIDTRRRRGRVSIGLPEAEPGEREPADPLRRVESTDTSLRVEAALERLDELTRCAVVLKYYEDLSSKQIGEVLELTPAAVDMRLSRARTQLRSLLEEPSGSRPA
jgi:RNA polymerase sigma factor (sigma-70 family)